MSFYQLEDINRMFRRSLLNCRMKTRVTILGFSVILVCSLLMYRAFTSHTTKNYIRQVPAFGHISQRLHSANNQHKLPYLSNLDEAFKAHILKNQKVFQDNLNVDLNQKEYETFKFRDLLNVSNRETLVTFLMKLYPTNWAEASETDEVALDLKYLLLDYGLSSNVSCKQIDNMRLGSPVSHAGSYLIDYAYDVSDETVSGNNIGYGSNADGKRSFEKSAYIVKSSSSDQEIKTDCMKQVYDADRCATMGNYRLLREVLLLTVLKHPNIVAMKGYCLRGNRVATRLQEKGVIVVTEMGSPLTMSVISSSTWPQKLSMALDIGKLLMYLNKSPLGSLRFKKLSLRDFVLVQGATVKLSDLDDIEIGDQACTDDSHCGISSINGIICKNDRCEGMNHIISFNIAAKEVLLAILQNPPGPDDESLVTKLRNQNIVALEFVKELHILMNKSKQEEHFSDENIKNAFPGKNEESQRIVLEAEQQFGENHAQAALNVQQANLDEVSSKFVRHARKNFAGIHDYQCVGSRVTWGCVHTVTSLLEAANLCLNDPLCQCFITFSTQPETDNLMTVVLKNGTDPSPHKSSGTTLFIRRTQLNSQKTDTEKKEAERNEQYMEKKETSSCLHNTLQSQAEAHYSREKRLMAHLGLKGSREQVWRKEALKFNMKGQSEMVKATGGGGRFVANLTSRDDDDELMKSKKVVFISEDGSHVYHMAYAVVYHLDRLLGLYHTPPCVGKQLSAEAVDQYLKNTKWSEMFRSSVQSDGTLSGLMVPPMPHIMKNMKLTLEPRDTMVSKIIHFNRAEKFQLEYILLWWLGKIDYKSSDHQGYKDHFIHFFADMAFANINLDMSGYLNHCQFPGVVYKSLACFMCDSKRDETSDILSDNVCSLGEEAFKRTHIMVAEDVEFYIHNMKEVELVAIINSVATSILHIINNCIKIFGEDIVLY